MKTLMKAVDTKYLTIKDMQDYYDRIPVRGNYINRKGLENWNPDIRAGKIKLPPEFACVDNGKVMTWEEVKQYRREQQKKILERKRASYNQVRKKPLYVWVFWTPGLAGIFEGLWIYIVGTDGIYHGGGYKGEVQGELLDEILRLFPLIDMPLFGFDYENLKLWKTKFIEKYKRGLWCGKPQGKALIWAEVKNRSNIKILCKAEWPNKRRIDESEREE
jgi:hypothetical protein